MGKRIPHQLDVYSELCPASSATIIGAGFVTITMGSAVAGVAVIVAGIGVGLLGPLVKSLQEYRHPKKTLSRRRRTA